MRNYCITVAALYLLASSAAGAATIVVNTLDDEITADGDCSLREAVQAVNMFEPVDACSAGDGNDTITFDSALLGQTIVLDLAGPDDDANATGDLDIQTTLAGGSIVITGPGTSADSIIIDGGAQADITAPDRIFHILGSENTALLEFSNLTLQNGSIGDPQTSFSPGGGAILAEYDGNDPQQIALLQLNNVAIMNNTVQAGFGGGGVFVDNVDALEITDSTISGNALNSNSTGAGGGFFVEQVGPVSITGSEFSDNSVNVRQGAGNGGGFAIGAQSFGNFFGGAASVIIDQSQFNGNSVTTDAVSGSDSPPDASGGGVSIASVDDALTITDSSFNTNTLDVSTTTFSGDALGGGLYVGSAGQASVTQTEFNGNSATAEDGDARGGGVYIGSTTAFNFTGGGASNNKLTTVLGDDQAGGNAEGGGLWTSFVDLQVDGSVFSNNELSAANAAAQGGGVRAQDLSLLSVNASEFSGNTLIGGQASAGGGVWVGGVSNTPTITGSEFASNTISAPTVFGGGLFLESNGIDSSPFESISITTTQFADNSLTAAALDARGSGLWLSTSTGATATISRSEFSGNSAATLGPLGADTGPLPVAYGAGLYINMADCVGADACVQLQNSTLSGNTLIAQDARADGAGLFVLTEFSNAIASFNNVTVANNTINASMANGGGFAVADSVTLQLANSLVATNSAGNSPDCATSISGGQITQPGTVVSLGFNLVGSPNGCNFTAAQGDLLGNEGQAIDPMLGTLGDNGGLTRTHALLAASPAIDAGNPDTPTGEIPNCMSVDQRGDPRPRDGNGDGTAECDIGALEREGITNAPPTIIQAIGNRTLQSNDDPITIDLSAVFSDPESGPLTYDVTSSNPASVLASIDGMVLTISPIDNGVATVDVTATDGVGAQATDSPVITVANQAPVIDNAIPDQGLSTNGSSQSFDLSTVFSDPENDPLTFTAESNNIAVVSTSIDGNLLIISPGQAGNATVSVTATDDLNATTTDQFGVNVEAVGNQPPNIISSIPDQTQRAGSDPVTFDLTTVFADPNEDTLTFTATSSDPAVVTAELQGNSLTLTPVAVGNASIDVTASDPNEATESLTLVFEVISENSMPTLIAEIPDQNLPPNGTTSIDLTQVFEDPDGDMLFFNASSSNSSVVAVDIDSDGLLTLTAGLPGTATITVSAQDTSGALTLARVSIRGNSGSNSSLGGSGGGGCVLAGPDNRSFDPILLLLIGLSVLGVALTRFRHAGAS